MIMMTGLVLMFHIFGLIEYTTNTLVLDLMLDPQNIKDYPVYTKLIAAIELVGLAGALILGYLNRSTELAASGLFVVWMLNMGWDFLQVVAGIAAHSKPLAVLVFSPLIIGYIMAAFDYWRGRS